MSSTTFSSTFSISVVTVSFSLLFNCSTIFFAYFHCFSFVFINLLLQQMIYVFMIYVFYHWLMLAKISCEKIRLKHSLKSLYSLKSLIQIPWRKDILRLIKARNFCSRYSYQSISAWKSASIVEKISVCS